MTATTADLWGGPITQETVQAMLDETLAILGDKFTATDLAVAGDRVEFKMWWEPNDDVMAPGVRIGTFPAIEFTGDLMDRWLLLSTTISSCIGALTLQYHSRRNVLAEATKTANKAAVASGEEPRAYICAGDDPHEVRIVPRETR